MSLAAVQPDRSLGRVVFNRTLRREETKARDVTKGLSDEEILMMRPEFLSNLQRLRRAELVERVKLERV